MHRARRGGKCSCLLVLLIVNLLLGGFCLNYTLNFCIGKKIPFVAAAPLGVILGEFTIPAACICAVCDLAGVEHPVFPGATKE